MKYSQTCSRVNGTKNIEREEIKAKKNYKTIWREEKVDIKDMYLYIYHFIPLILIHSLHNSDHN